MAFNALKSAFESKLTTEDCWQIPSALRMEIIQLFNEVQAMSIESAAQFIEVREGLSRLLQQDNLTEIEQKQCASLQALFNAPRFPDSAKSAILNDLIALAAEPLPA